MPGGRLVVTPQPEQPGCDYLLSAFALLDNDGGNNDSRGGAYPGGYLSGGGGDVDTTWRTVASASPVKRITTGGGTDIPKKPKKKQSGTGVGSGSGLGSRRGVGLEVGDKVEVNYEGMGAYYPGVITSCSNNDDNGGVGVCYDIRYDDGDTESNVPFDMIKRLVLDHHQRPSQQQQEDEEGGADDENDNANDNDNQAAINISALSQPSTPQHNPNFNFNFNPSSSRGFSPTSGANPTQPMRLRDEDGRLILVPGVHKLTVVFKPDDERWVSSTWNPPLSPPHNGYRRTFFSHPFIKLTPSNTLSFPLLFPFFHPSPPTPPHSSPHLSPKVSCEVFFCAPHRGEGSNKDPMGPTLR